MHIRTFSHICKIYVLHIHAYTRQQPLRASGSRTRKVRGGGISTWPLSLVLLPRSEWTCLRCACNPTPEYLAMNLGVSVTPRPLPSRRPQLLTKHLHEAARKGHCLSAAFLCLLRCLCCKNAITLKTCRKLWTRGYLAYSPVSGIQELNSSPNLAGSSPGVSIQSHPGL